MNLLLAFLIASLFPLAAQEPATKHQSQQTAARNPQAARQKQVEDQIVALEKRLWNGDATDVSKLEADDYEAIKHGHRYTRIDDEAAAKDAKFALVLMEDVRVRLLRPDVALLTYHAMQKGTFRGTEVPRSLYFASLWVNGGGVWKNVFLEENLPDVFTETYMPLAETSVAGHQSATSTANAERYIRDSESQWAEAVASGDVSVVQRILSDDFIGVDAGDGHLYPKAEAISWIQEHHTEYLFNHLDDVKVRFFGDTAVAQGSESWERRAGEPRRGRFAWTDTWVFRNGQWQITAAEDLIAPARPTNNRNAN
jgi:ketosteroid isomerase-like protein